MNENQLAGQIIGCAIRVHRNLGPGLLENAYQECLFYELKKEGIYVEKEKYLPLIYDGVEVDCAYRIDLLVEKKVVIELKSVQAIHPLHVAQTITYLRIGGYRLGLLINFNETLLKNGIKRIVNNLPE
jgi:GxxExxY protein